MSRHRTQWHRLLCTSAVGGMLVANGCFATLERSVDLIFAPSATENLLRLPYSGLAALSRLAVGLFGF